MDLWLRGEALPQGHPFRPILAHPMGPTSPEIWILGSSDYGAQLAAALGYPYAYAYFFTDGRGTEEALALYRDNYRPSARFPEPVATICVWALAADTEAEARRLLMTREHWRVGFEKGLRTPLVSPEEAEAHPYTDAERAIVQRLRDKAIVGTGAQVARAAARAGGDVRAGRDRRQHLDPRPGRAPPLLRARRTIPVPGMTAP